jgi:enterochelin esterase-like enzyme
MRCCDSMSTRPGLTQCGSPHTRSSLSRTSAAGRRRASRWLPAERTAVFGVSASGELALAIGLLHPAVYGAIFCASPGAGYRPPETMPRSVPRTYLVGGTLEPFFLENATRWATALRDAGKDVVMTERVGSHGDALWREELLLMVAWAFGR